MRNSRGKLEASFSSTFELFLGAPAGLRARRVFFCGEDSLDPGLGIPVIPVTILKEMVISYLYKSTKKCIIRL